MLRPYSIKELARFFGAGTCKQQQSVCGAMLERAQCARYDSAGKPIPLVPARQWMYIQLKKDGSYEPSYEPSHDDVMNSASVSRRLGRIDKIYAAALELYYGDIGAEWEKAFAGTRWMFCVGPLTTVGEQIHGLRGGNPVLAIHGTCVDYDRSVRNGTPDDMTKYRLNVLAKQCQELLLEAHNAYRNVSNEKASCVS